MLKLREKLGRGKPLPLVDVLFELGLQRTRYTQLEKNPDEPLLHPKLEILVRALDRWPQISITQTDLCVSDAIDLLDAVRPHRRHTARDVALLCGAEASSGAAWARGVPMNMLTRRVLRALMVVVGDAEPADRAAALDEFEAVARLVALSHGLDPADLAAKGFSGYRSRRRGKKGSP